MTDIDIGNDLEQVNIQIEQLVGQLNKMNTEREQLAQQIHNLNGIAMYLRGKQGENGVQFDPEEDLERTIEYPAEG